MVDFIFRISFATEQELGWDTSITLYRPRPLIAPNEVQYDIKVRDDAKGTTRTFRTRRLISSIGADALRGRGTRVWEVVELKNGKEGTSKHVLKDAWVDVERERE